MSKTAVFLFKFLGYPVIFLTGWLVLYAPGYLLDQMSQINKLSAYILSYLIVLFLPAMIDGFYKREMFSVRSFTRGVLCVGVLAVLHIITILWLNQVFLKGAVPATVVIAIAFFSRENKISAL